MSDDDPDRDEHRHQRQQRPDDRAEPHGEEEEDEQDGEVGEHDPVRLEVVEQADADHGEARRRGPDALGRLGVRHGCSRTTGARSSSEPGPVRKMMLNARSPWLTVDAWMSVGATS